MAVRYSADVEVRMRYDARRRLIVGVVSDGRQRPFHGTVATYGRPSPETYDRAAVLLIQQAWRGGSAFVVDRRGRRIRLRRTFQAPCPT